MGNWWHEQPLRLVQTNLQESDIRRNPREIVREVAAFDANAILFSVGGIVSFYPSKLPFQTPSPLLSSDIDFVGEARDEARKLGLRFIARLDLSKCHKHVFDHHPEWFFRRADGKPQVYNGLYSTCVNGGYYRAYSFEIINEIIERYDVDGLFFNMFGYQPRDYSGTDHGICQCVNCRSRFREMFGRELPTVENPNDPNYLDYLSFKEITSREAAQQVGDYIHTRKPGIAFSTYSIHGTDLVRSEANTAVDRPLPLWQYSASDNVKRAQHTYPHKRSLNTAVYFLDIPYRFAEVSADLTSLRLAQNVIHSAPLDLYVLGTLDQPNRSGLKSAQEIFSFQAKHEQEYQGLTSLAQVCLLYPHRSFPYGKSSETAYRGMFRLLTENHIPFDCVHEHRLTEEDANEFLAKYKLLILPGAALLSDRQSEVIDSFVATGGKVLATGETGFYTETGRPRPENSLKSLGASRVELTRSDMRSAYFRIHDQHDPGLNRHFPLDKARHFNETDLIFLDGNYLYLPVKEEAEKWLSLIPPTTYGPPEKVFSDAEETDWPGVIFYRYGRGTSAYLPWQVDALYYRFSSPGHTALLLAVLDSLTGGDRQLVSNAHPSVEIALLARKDGAYMLNLANASGHGGTAIFPPIPMRDLVVKIALPQPVTTACSLKQGRPVELWREQGYTCVRVGQLELFDSIILR
ncbi:MAG: beta-galactosidase [Chloroflexi bacterium]|nr:beta-galactosidase [Chloroflexota bacterium]MBN9396931.1 beta-galactosidase [Candidatus Melainabacteria bacterium]OJV92950.1 MAG: hypothetical protein BGO39_03270 [Chloroflexi bacterium 54-19]